MENDSRKWYSWSERQPKVNSDVTVWYDEGRKMLTGTYLGDNKFKERLIVGDVSVKNKWEPKTIEIVDVTQWSYFCCGE